VSTVGREDHGNGSANGRIVVGVDGSPSSRAALRWAVRQAGMTGSSIEVVAAWGFPVYIGDADFWPVDVDQEEIVAHQLKRVLDEIVPSASTVPLSAVVTRGPPAAALLERVD